MSGLVPLVAVPSQALTITLAGQRCQIKVYQKRTGMYFDLAVANVPVVTGMMCRDRVLLVRHTYLGFIGSLAFFDTQGTSDPEYAGLGDRFQLGYLDA